MECALIISYLLAVFLEKKIVLKGPHRLKKYSVKGYLKNVQ